MNNDFILELKEVGINDIDRVGGKNASLGEMIQHLTGLGLNIPNGFVITVAAYKKFLEYNNLESTISHIINTIEYENLESLRRGGAPGKTVDQQWPFSQGNERGDHPGLRTAIF